MQIIHADKDFKDLREITMIKDFDSVLSDKELSDYRLILSKEEYLKSQIKIGEIIYLEGTEFGGYVDRIKSIGYTFEVYGKNWRGYLNKNLILPPPEQAYKEVDAKAKVVMEDILGDFFGDDFVVLDSTVIIKDKYRYDEIGYALAESLRKVAARLEIKQVDDHVELKAVPITDWSEEYEFSEDYGVLLIIDKDESTKVNHIVALGKGELENRLVIEAFLLDDGTVIYNPNDPRVPQGKDRVTHKLDYPNAEGDDELKKKIAEMFGELRAKTVTEMDLSGVQLVNLELGDIVASRDRTTGVYVKQRISQKVFKMGANGIPKIEYKVEEV